MNILARLFWTWYACGLILLVFFGVPASLQFANGLFLLFYFLYNVRLFSQSGEGSRRLAVSALAIVILTMALESFGVRTGFPFGSYSYGAELGWAIGGVPVAVGLAWAGILLNVALMSGAVDRLRFALTVGLWTAGLDLVLDPVAMDRGWWDWGNASLAFYDVPLSNFAAWFAVAFCLSFLVPIPTATANLRRTSTRLYQAMVAFFAILALGDGLLWAAAVGLILVYAAERMYLRDRSAKVSSVPPSV